MEEVMLDRLDLRVSFFLKKDRAPVRLAFSTVRGALSRSSSTLKAAYLPDKRDDNTPTPHTPHPSKPAGSPHHSNGTR
jgi:hypothetical protein